MQTGPFSLHRKNNKQYIMNALDNITNSLPAPIGQIVNMAANTGLKLGKSIGQEISDMIDDLFDSL